MYPGGRGVREGVNPGVTCVSVRPLSLRQRLSQRPPFLPNFLPKITAETIALRSLITPPVRTIRSYLADAFIQSHLQLIRLSRGPSLLEQCGVRGLILLWLHRGLNHQPSRSQSCTLATRLQATGYPLILFHKHCSSKVVVQVHSLSQSWFHTHDRDFSLLLWPTGSPDLNPIKQFWAEVEEQVHPWVKSSYASFTSLKVERVKLVIRWSSWARAGQPASTGSLSELVAGN